MDRKIKTRQVHKDIKVLDKTVTVTIGIGKEQPQHYLFGVLFPSFTLCVRLSPHTAFHRK